MQFEIEYACKEHKEMLIRYLKKKDGLFGLSGAGAVKPGKAHSYGIYPLDGVDVVTVKKPNAQDQRAGPAPG